MGKLPFGLRKVKRLQPRGVLYTERPKIRWPEPEGWYVVDGPWGDYKIAVHRRRTEWQDTATHRYRVKNHNGVWVIEAKKRAAKRR